ncbi:TonB-dependent receptor; Outer membrane receptor for ferrienterochelin and colicins [hydrothermal vent metagenome]|uniref:TonB-dependent receptor Outer membrane receptor for ferrienterochelin and colicins n=1 Tax=hydrothermal vent metagenome TaxID=652676 RepID=A0A3B1BC80_9ZZZZ
MDASYPLAILIFAAALAPPTIAAAENELTELSLEELMEVQVTSVAKKPQSLANTAAAAFVITQEDIRRSGAIAMPDLLRMVPGMNVARIDANTWAVSARGFNDWFSNKLLVMIDGRSVYTPFFSGVYWDAQKLLLEDIERIEVVRGPGGTIWGANAVNGVINVITKHASDTTGNLTTVKVDSQESGTISYRHGGQTTGGLSYRVYGKAAEQGAGSGGADDGRVGRIGFRTDLQTNHQNTYTLSGEAYRGTMGERFEPNTLRDPYFRNLTSDSEISGGHLLARWVQQPANERQLEVQAYLDHSKRDQFYFEDSRTTFDLDMHYRFPFSDRQEIHWGAGWRYIENDSSPALWHLNPDSRSDQKWSFFIQDEITIIPERLRVTIGSKFEHNDYTGFEYQPSARVLWTPSSWHSLWSSWSRAVRTPSRFEHDGSILRAPTAAPNTYITIEGDSRMVSEVVYAYELGYRFQPRTDLLLDAALFYNVYDKLRTIEPSPPHASPPHLIPHTQIPAIVDNKLRGETYGLELAAKWQLSPQWALHAAYSYLDMQLHTASDSGDLLEEGDEKDSPTHQLFLRSTLNLPHAWELDADLRYVSETMRNEQSIQDGGEDYLTLDLRLGWRPHPGLELALGGRNLLGKKKEYRSALIDLQETEAAPTVYGSLVWHY